MTQGKETTAVRLLVEYLKGEGVEYVFGIPGGALINFYEALFDLGGIKAVLAKHEGGAAFMADGYARASGKIGVCCSTTGPGVTNLITGIACAYADSIPLLVITGQVSTSSFGKGAFQESSCHGVDVVSISGSKGKRITPEEAWDSPEYAAARSGRSAVESLMFTIKHNFDFGRVARRGLAHVTAEMLEKILAYNFCRMSWCRRADQVEVQPLNQAA